MNSFIKQNHGTISNLDGMPNVNELPKKKIWRPVCIQSIGIIYEFALAPVTKSKHLNKNLNYTGLELITPEPFFKTPQWCWWICFFTGTQLNTDSILTPTNNYNTSKPFSITNLKTKVLPTCHHITTYQTTHKDHYQITPPTIAAAIQIALLNQIKSFMSC